MAATSMYSFRNCGGLESERVRRESERVRGKCEKVRDWERVKE
jgi:hypothetical protein